MSGHESVKALLKDYLSTWVPFRLGLYRDVEEWTTPVDPEWFVQDSLPEDRDLFPCGVIMSTRTLGMTRVTGATAAGDTAAFDVDYEVVVVMAAATLDSAVPQDAVRDRDRLLLMVRECVLLPAKLDDLTMILGTPMPSELTGAAAQNLQANPLAAGQITFTVRAREALIPMAEFESIATSTLTVDPVDAGTTTIPED